MVGIAVELDSPGLAVRHVLPGPAWQPWALSAQPTWRCDFTPAWTRVNPSMPDFHVTFHATHPSRRGTGLRLIQVVLNQGGYRHTHTPHTTPQHSTWCGGGHQEFTTSIPIWVVTPPLS
jgi:hypothetical protein